MYIALLGRQPELSIAELERVFPRVSWYSSHTALVDAGCDFDVQRLGGTQKAGRVAFELQNSQWRSVSDAIVRHYSREWAKAEGKITLGISVYDIDVSAREVQKIGLVLKSQLKKSGVSLRLVPNLEPALSSATSHHNKLGLSANKVELLIVRGKTSVMVAESIGTQNITALAARDQGRPRRDAFVGMLPPKLAIMMINLALGSNTEPQRVLDPFCGTGVLLQEAALLGNPVYGTDLAEKMIRFSTDNLNWLQSSYNLPIKWDLHEGDAVDTRWQAPIDAVASEAYLGQPFSAPPSNSKLTEVRGNCNHIIGSFLTNISKQLKPGTPLVLAVPAWKDVNDNFTRLPLVSKVEDFGFEHMKLDTVDVQRLIYVRPDQVVGRDLLLLIKK
ncbi:MAG: TRM11 family SAM-dependent methyltransferase [Candidatus Saccharimonadaceae bacterium]